MSVNVLKGNFVSAPALGKLDCVENGYLVLEDGLIQGIFEALPEQYHNAQITDFSDRLILQSFSDMHLHAPQYPMLGLGMDLQLLDWLTTYTFPVEAQFADTGYAREVYARLASKLVHSGTTRVVMFASIHTDATLVLMEELERAGVTGYVGKVCMDRNGLPGVYEETTEGSERETLRFFEAAAQFSHIKPIVTPRFTPTCSDELMAWLGRQARTRGLYVQSHLSENKDEIAWVRRLHPDCAEYWETYDKFGLFSDHTVMAHCVYSGAREREAMKRRNVLVAHCPDSNINLCSGFVPLRTMLDEGLWIGLGSDIAGGAELPMNRVITAAIRMSKAKRIETEGTAGLLTVAEGYYLGTTAGAAYFGAGNGFAAGDPLHAIVVDESGFPPAKSLTLQERMERAIYLMDERSIQAVYSEGVRVV